VLVYDELREIARVVEYRFFGGMTNEDIAEALGVTDDLQTYRGQ